MGFGSGLRPKVPTRAFKEASGVGSRRSLKCTDLGWVSIPLLAHCGPQTDVS